jgi:formamidopyrimidine-DNA glycosylase
MPELPEVETIRRGLERELVGRCITGVTWHRERKLRASSPRPLQELAGRQVASARRRGKFILLSLSDESVLLLHLGMTGKLLFCDPRDALRPHTHLVLDLDDGRQLRFSDPRRFGLLKLYPGGAAVHDLDHFGVEPMDEAFTPEALGILLSASRAPLKAFLLDQRRVAGLGNIYACEALWRARLSPRRQARRTPRASVGLLRDSIEAVLADSLAQGGTSFNDYVDHIGQPGKFIADLAVFQRKGLPCPRCSAPIRRIVQSGRSTFYCPACQR